VQGFEPRPDSVDSATMAEPPRRFPAPWRADKVPGGYVVRDANRLLPQENWTFAGTVAGGHRAAAAYTLIETCMCGWPPRCKSFV
jgi:hypothetical protein